MRNQTWNQQGQLAQDLELYREAGIAKLKDWFTGVVRSATAEEEAVLRNTEALERRQAARVRAIAAIKANQGSSPWGSILYDLAVSQGLIEPD